MKDLFTRKQRLQSNLERLWRARLSERPHARIPYNEASALLGQIKDVDAALESRRKLLAQVVYCLLREIESLAIQGHLHEVAQLANAAHRLTGLLYEERSFPWSSILRSLRHYERSRIERGCAEECHFVSMLKEVIGG